VRTFRGRLSEASSHGAAKVAGAGTGLGDRIARKAGDLSDTVLFAIVPGTHGPGFGVGWVRGLSGLTLGSERRRSNRSVNPRAYRTEKSKTPNHCAHGRDFGAQRTFAL
jgi:hypothetical protein